ncbi:hypothetical protein [Micromonospora sp. RP3T]|uniref:hypothetical protein n=1 Tax=Micromonospora sp. RP3T TaxID=2135446 RepID=UPI000D15697F|nr:hypothetical protein [Micromonospora sp. RP3T]PTA46896.1 hypothetical protein C8054_07410 [Micromonospora sp. RP3T]
MSAVRPTDAESGLTADELALRQGIEPVACLDELARPELFESDDELDRFLADLYASRRDGVIPG